MPTDFFEEDLWDLGMEEQTTEFTHNRLFGNIIHARFKWDDDLNDTYLDKLERSLRIDESGFIEEALLAHTLYIDPEIDADEADLTEVQDYLVEFISLFSGIGEIHRNRRRLYISFTGNEFSGPTVYRNRLIMTILEDAFVNDPTDLYVPNFKLMFKYNFLLPRYFLRQYIKRKRPRFRNLPRPPRKKYVTYFDELPLIDDDEYEIYLLQRKTYTANYDIKIYERLEEKRFQKEKRRLRMKWDALYKYPKEKVPTPVAEPIDLEFKEAMEFRKFIKGRTELDDSLFADLFTFEDDLPDESFFEADDFYATEFINPHSRS